MSLIFGTSCTLITRQQFVDTVGVAVPKSVGGRRAFDDFWFHNWVLFVKGWHFLEFLILSLLLFRFFRVITDPVKALVITAIAAALFAISDEWHQTFVPHRGGRLSDVLIDCAGAVIASALLLVRMKRGNNVSASSEAQNKKPSSAEG